MKKNNLFIESRKGASVKKVSRHEVVDLTDSYEKCIERISEIDSEISSLKREREELDSVIRDRAKKVMVGLYVEKNRFPGTLMFLSGSRSFLFTTCDKYLDIDGERAEYLTGKYGSDVVTEKTVYTVNPEMVEKYGDVLSRMIMKSRKIASEDKRDMIRSSVSWSVAKGIITRLRTVPFIRFALGSVIDDIRPVFQLKIDKEPT